MTTEVSKVGQAQTAQQAQPKAALKADARIEVFEGMTVNDVEQNGSEAQKIVAKAFDRVTKEKDYKEGNGKYSEREAEDLNNYRFALDKTNRELRAHNIETGTTVTIKYNNLQELKENAALVKTAGQGIIKGGQITYDFRSKTATFDGVTAPQMNIASRGKADKVIIRNCDVERLAGYGFHGQLELDNVKDMGMLWDSPTELYLEPDATLKSDANSKVKIKRYNHEK